MNNQKKYNTFRLTFPEFVYESFQYDVQPDGLHISFSFKICGVGETQPVRFAPTAFIPTRPFLNFNQPKAVMDNLVFHIGMIELISYWKSFCPPVIRVACGTLDENQIAFWKKLYYHGLGEFFYTNSIKATQADFVTITSPLTPRPSPLTPHPSPLTPPRGYLVPIGGGKDSVVTLETLRPWMATMPVRPLIMNPRGATVQCVEVAGFSMDDVLVIRRTIHPTLLDLNAKGALNGHTPFSAMLAFYTLLASQLSGQPNIALSNENSANESTVIGSEVNHQYSKSIEFENDFRSYVATYLSKEYNYFSFLRPLTELQIAKLFAEKPIYFDVFKSCNVGSKQDIWCGHCPKCLFAYIILSPFISPDRLSAIFGKNMLDDSEMTLYFDQLTGQAPTKPFECVGTVSEVHQAIALTLERWYADGQPPVLLRHFIPQAPRPDLTSMGPSNLSSEQLALLAARL